MAQESNYKSKKHPKINAQYASINRGHFIYEESLTSKPDIPRPTSPTFIAVAAVSQYGVENITKWGVTFTFIDRSVNTPLEIIAFDPKDISAVLKLMGDEFDRVCKVSGWERRVRLICRAQKLWRLHVPVQEADLREAGPPTKPMIQTWEWTTTREDRPRRRTRLVVPEDNDFKAALFAQALTARAAYSGMLRDPENQIKEF